MARFGTFFLISFLSVNLLFSQIPTGYYDSAEGLTGENLRTALYNIIKNHDQQSYSSLWNHFQNTDRKANGKVWDMYSTRADGTYSYQYTFVTDQCGNYSGEGSCYNREHSFPKSWFNDDYPEYSDLFHLYPTDGYTNGQRSNLPYGEVGTASWTSTNGCKKGSSNYPGYSGTVFEPIDEFKGDFARSYFYMLTRYKNNVSSWSSAMLSGSNFSTWAENLLLDWNEQDPVSQKEIDRNNTVYGIQDNRNPFIDHPEWAVYVWDPSSANINNKKNDNVKVWYSNNNLTWELKQASKGVLEIYNIVGQKIEVIPVDSRERTTELNLKKGVYIADFRLDYRRVLKFTVK